MRTHAAEYEGDSNRIFLMGESAGAHLSLLAAYGVDEQPLREIYLAAFERIVKKASPHTMMCSYNRINGVYSCENKWLLEEVLRKEWGFDGIVMTDWAAMDDRPRALEAGLEFVVRCTEAY